MPLAPSTVTLAADDAALIDGAREFARNELLSLDRKWDEDESTLGEALPQLSEMGMLGLLVPEELGGIGCRYTTFVAILHELSYASPSTCVSISVHCLAGGAIERFAPEPLRSKLISGWHLPENFGAFALSEAGAGSDAGSVSTRAVVDGEGYRLNGEKMWVTNGLSARWFLTLARIHNGTNQGQLTAFLVGGEEAGIERTKISGKMGIRGSETAVISLSNVFVPRTQLFGTPGRGLEVFLSSLNRGRVGIAAQATGIAEACFDEMSQYARQRVQFGQPIGSFNAVASMVADSAVELEASKLLVWRAATRIDQGANDRSATSMAKAYATESANRTAYRAVQVHGAAGYVRECRVEQLYRDARVTSIYEGTSEIQRIVIARDLA